MKEKLLKIFFVLSILFLVFVISVKSTTSSSAEVPFKPIKITKQDPKLPCMLYQQHVILEKLHRIEEKIK
tara:strand:- start:609 stop:818 length:210 start_codon:yes stop_codon:yes gene_type:complete